ncbi:MAG: NAD(P)-binding domain-containing protein, partial [Candidatus Andersenbacteria bacterium]
MEVGLIGVGKMGLGLLKRWQTAGHTVVTHDVAAAAAEKVKAVNAVFYPELEQFVAALSAPRRIWLMIPAATVPSVIDELATRLDAGDTVIDGGNSFFKDSHTHAVKLDKRGVHFIDVGVSGGLAGETTGYALMVGGNPDHITDIQDLLTSLAAPGAYLHAGPAGAGHFVKMVHNAIEYGMMQAIGE